VKDLLILKEELIDEVDEHLATHDFVSVHVTHVFEVWFPVIALPGLRNDGKRKNRDRGMREDASFEISMHQISRPCSDLPINVTISQTKSSRDDWIVIPSEVSFVRLG
jgi:hypothetical protein